MSRRPVTVRTISEDTELYDRLASEDGDAEAGYYWHAAPDSRLRAISETVARLGPASVLDVGCGDGVALERAVPARCGFRAGLDLSLVSLGRLKTRRAGWAVKGDGAMLPFKDAFFEAVLMNQVLEHVTDPKALLAEAARVTAPGGAIVVTVPVADWFRLYKGLLSGGRASYLDPETHLREWSLLPLRGFDRISCLLDMLGDSGFRIQRAEGVFLYTWRMEKLMDKLLEGRSQWYQPLLSAGRLAGRLPLLKYLAKYLLITATRT